MPARTQTVQAAHSREGIVVILDVLLARDQRAQCVWGSPVLGSGAKDRTIYKCALVKRVYTGKPGCCDLTADVSPDKQMLLIGLLCSLVQ